MTKHALINQALLVMMLFLLVSSVATVNAQTTGGDDDDDDDDETTETEDEQEDEENETDDDDINERELEIQVEATQVQIQSKLASGENEHVFKVEVHADDELKFKVSFEQETESTETEREFEVEFKELVEFLDENDNGVYDNENDSAIQVLELDSFEPIAYTVVNESGVDVHIFDVTSTDGVFTARLYASGLMTDVNGTILAPSQVKIDVIIRDFNFTDENSLLALNVKLQSSLETEYDDHTEDEEDGRASDEAEIEVLSTDFPGFFSWKETAEIDGVTYAVNSSIEETESNEQEIYLNYPQGSVIIHDPKLGFENVLLDPNAFQLPPVLTDNAVPLIAIAAIAVVGIVLVGKKRI